MLLTLSLKIVGDIKGLSIEKEVIEQWCDGMKNGVMKDRRIIGKIGDSLAAFISAQLRGMEGMQAVSCFQTWVFTSGASS